MHIHNKYFNYYVTKKCAVWDLNPCVVNSGLRMIPTESLKSTSLDHSDNRAFFEHSLTTYSGRRCSRAELNR